MIYGTHYQTFITDKDLVDGGVQALNSLEVGQVAIIDETPGHVGQVIAPNWDKVLFFSLYEAVINDNGKKVLMKHSGAKPIHVPTIRKITSTFAKESHPQYWQLELTENLVTCCKDYTIRFSMQSEQIQKSQFPNYFIQEPSVKKECCEEACGAGDNPFTNIELAILLWSETNLTTNGYVRADIMTKEGGEDTYNFPVTYFVNGEAYFGNTSDERHFKANDISHGKVMWNGRYYTIADLLTEWEVNVDLSEVAIRFFITPEIQLNSGNINLKYDYLRDVKADANLLDGFACAEGISFYNNETEEGAAKIFDNNGNSVPVFSYSVGSGYDVRQMEQYDSRRTVNSPYPFSKFSHSENGMQFLSDENKMYDLLTIEYTQHSDALGGEFPHPHGCTIAIVSGSSEKVCTKENRWTVYYIGKAEANDLGIDDSEFMAVLDHEPQNNETVSADEFVDIHGLHPYQQATLVITDDDPSNINTVVLDPVEENICEDVPNISCELSSNWTYFIAGTLNYINEECIH